jgi:large subunit ribosomal protein L18
MSVFRSARHVYAQIIDDTEGVTLATASSVEKVFKEQDKFESKKAAATYVGKLLAERALDKGIKKVVFDRNGFLYHGRVKALSDGAREAGLEL